jgi:hypothetical protein
MILIRGRYISATTAHNVQREAAVSKRGTSAVEIARLSPFVEQKDESTGTGGALRRNPRLPGNAIEARRNRNCDSIRNALTMSTKTGRQPHKGKDCRDQNPHHGGLLNTPCCGRALQPNHSIRTADFSRVLTSKAKLAQSALRHFL